MIVIRIGGLCTSRCALRSFPDPEVGQPRDLAHMPGFVEVAAVGRDQNVARGGKGQRAMQRVEKRVVELAGDVDRTRAIQFICYQATPDSRQPRVDLSSRQATLVSCE